ncbi:MAG: hypothetical protein U0791_26800 [Gemmataceae bacterium]
MSKRRLQLLYKGDKCAACGISVAEMVARYGTFHRLFEFNHVNPAEKDPDYKNLIRQKLSAKQLDELDKCVLLCDHCHDIVHAQNITGEMELTVEALVDGKRKRVKQKLRGQLIVDAVDRKITFLTNERVQVEFYRVHLGSRKPVVMTGAEVSSRLTSLLARIGEYGSVTIRAWDKTQMLHAVHLARGEYDLIHDIRFPFMRVELVPTDGPVIWLRNGIAITKDGLFHGTVTYNRMKPLEAGVRA